MPFQFITSDIGPKERRLIRSHVMVGRNAGRPRQSRRKRRDTSHRQIRSKHETLHDNMIAAKYHMQDNTRSGLFDRLICNDLAFADMPHQDVKSIELLRQWLSLLDRRLYPPEFCSRLDFMDYVWLQYVFYDEGYMHGVLAIKASFRDHLGMQARASPDVLQHLSKAYKLTQRRLAGPEAISDKSIAGVTILAIYQLVHGSVEVGLVHFDGLCQMVRLRGGLATLMKHNRALAQKPWRIDLEFALQSGLRMRFCGAEAPLPTKTMSPKVISPTYTKLYEHGIDVELICLLSDVTVFTNSLNAINELSRLDPLDFSEQAFQLIHRLIDFAPLRGKRPSRALDELLQLTLLAIMTTSLPNYTTDELRYELLAKQLKRAILRYIDTADRNGELLLWAVFVGRVSILHGHQDDWITPILMQLSEQVQIHSWPQIRRILSGYCWIHTLHDAVAMKIWARIKENKSVE